MDGLCGHGSAPGASRLAEAPYTCVSAETRELAALATRDGGVPLWVSLVNGSGGHVEAHSQSVGSAIESLSVYVRYGGESASAGEGEFCSEGTIGEGETRRLACGGYSGWDGRDPRPAHGDVGTVAATSEHGHYRCERHQDSDREISVWACDTW